MWRIVKRIDYVQAIIDAEGIRAGYCSWYSFDKFASKWYIYADDIPGIGFRPHLIDTEPREGTLFHCNGAVVSKSMSQG